MLTSGKICRLSSYFLFLHSLYRHLSGVLPDKYHTLDLFFPLVVEQVTVDPCKYNPSSLQRGERRTGSYWSFHTSVTKSPMFIQNHSSS